MPSSGRPARSSVCSRRIRRMSPLENDPSSSGGTIPSSTSCETNAGGTSAALAASCASYRNVDAIAVVAIMTRTRSTAGSPGPRRRSNSGDRPDVRERAASVPRRERPDELGGTFEIDAVVARGLGPAEPTRMPLDEGLGLRRDEQVLVETGVRLADLGFPMLDEQPVPFPRPVAGEVEADHDASVGQAVPSQRVAHRPQGHERVEVLGGDLEPSGSPLAERLADPVELVPRRSELVRVPAPARLGRGLDGPEPLELSQPLREEGAEEPGGALQDLAERLASEIQIPDDQRGPALGEDLGAPGDRAVLAVGSHAASLAPRRPDVKSRYGTSRPRSAVVRCRRSPSEEAAAMEIDGFRGAVISADHPDYDVARAVWNGAVDRRPRAIARRTGASDAAAAVRFAREHDFEIAVRGGGHNVGGTGVCDDGLVVDLSAMRGVRVDPADRTAWAQ